LGYPPKQGGKAVLRNVETHVQENKLS